MVNRLRILGPMEPRIVDFLIGYCVVCDNIMTTALLDRLTSKGHIIEFIGESYRFRHRVQIEEQATATQTG